VAGPFESENDMGAVRFSPDSKKLAVMSDAGRCLDVWDVHAGDLRVIEENDCASDMVKDGTLRRYRRFSKCKHT
jgi:hypothetical protein